MLLLLVRLIGYFVGVVLDVESWIVDGGIESRWGLVVWMDGWVGGDLGYGMDEERIERSRKACVPTKSIRGMPSRFERT